MHPLAPADTLRGEEVRRDVVVVVVVVVLVLVVVPVVVVVVVVVVKLPHCPSIVVCWG